MEKIKLLLLLLAISFILSFSNAQIPNYVPTSGLVGWWPFSGNTNDLSGTGNNGVNTGATLTSDRNGAQDKSYLFTASNSKVTIPYNSSLNVQLTKQFSAACWINIETLPSLDPRVLYLSSLYATNYDLSIMGKGQGTDSMRVNLTNYNESSYNFMILSNISLTRKTWYHLAFTVDAINNSTKLYIDGNLVASTNIPPVIPTSSVVKPQIFTIGNHDAANWGFDGKIDDVGAWNRILTPQEISTLRNAGVGIKNDVKSNENAITYAPNMKSLSVNLDVLNPSNEYALKLVNALGQEVLVQKINDPHAIIDLSYINYNGLLVAYLVKNDGSIEMVKKIII